MRSRAPWALSTLAAALAALVPCAEPAAAQRRNEVSLDANIIGLTLGYARAVGWGEERWVGVELGAGGDFIGAMLLAGRHFSEEWGPSYEQKDGYVDKLLLEIGHVAAFLRERPSERLEWDVGVRGSAFFHSDTSDDDIGAGWFAGMSGAVLYGWKHVKIGPRLNVGVFSEGRPELGVYLAPLTVRGSIRW